MNLRKDKSEAPELTSPLKMKSRIYMYCEVTPWIEELILSYGSSEKKKVSGCLTAHVVGLDKMTESLALGWDGPTEIVFLSDGQVRIPAALTTRAWKNLMEFEEREYIQGLLNNTMLIQVHQLKFHMAKELNECWFYLSIGKMCSLASGLLREFTECCTTLSSVRMKIRQTWQACLVEENFVWGHNERVLSQLLEAWDQDFVDEMMEDIREKLMVGRRPGSGSRLRTSWDVDRVRYKRMERFTVPVRYLLIPEEVEAPTGGAAQPVTEVDPPQAPGCDAGESPPVPEQDSPLHDLILSDSDDVLSSSNSSPEMTPILPECGPAASSNPDSVAMVTSTQKAKKKRCEVTAEPGVLEQEEPSGSPPSWLFDPTGTSIREEPSNPSTEPDLRKVLDTHSDGKPFMYTYKVTGQNLQDLIQFKMPASLLHWAVKYLVTARPKDPL
uniref:Shelterin complex subunit TPP1/Est3 domain-containing protein n=1 Tax=Oryzias melastigma TaxID=30732 RepID=A0A3B3DP47_ORYME